MKQLFHTTLRLYLNDLEDRRAYKHLRSMENKEYRSYSKAIVAAVNDSFDRQHRLRNNPYQETREKEDALLQRIIEVIQSNQQFMPVGYGMITSQSMSSSDKKTVQTTQPVDEEDADNALDFALGIK